MPDSLPPMMGISRVTVQGQVAVPSSVRTMCGIKPGDKFVWYIDRQTKEVSILIQRPENGEKVSGLTLKTTYRE